MKIAIPKGTKDILKEEMNSYRFIEKQFSKIQKEMYTFLDKGKRSLTLRPEGTAGVIRSFISNGMASLPQPVKLFYMGKMYRYENVQKGRYREFTQIGLEAIGSSNPIIDVEVIGLLNMFFSNIGISNLQLRINSIGCKTCKTKYDIILKQYYKEYIDDLCDDCKKRYDKNPLRLLDCKNSKCKVVSKDAPYLLDNLCEQCSDDFNSVKAGLDNLGIEYYIDKTIVRGLDYYTKTVFEFISENVGTQGTICGGGRYNKLVESLGGKDSQGVGFALGVERLLMELEAREIKLTTKEYPILYVATIGEKAYAFANQLIYKLRKEGLYVEIDVLGRSLKSQMKYANKINATYTIVLGDDEIQTNKCKIKIMETGIEKDISVDSIINRMKENKV